MNAIYENKTFPLKIHTADKHFQISQQVNKGIEYKIFNNEGLLPDL